MESDFSASEPFSFASTGLVQSYRTRPRCGDYVIGQIYAVGGLTKNGESVSTVEIYDPVTKEWRMGEAMSMLR